MVLFKNDKSKSTANSTLRKSCLKWVLLQNSTPDALVAGGSVAEAGGVQPKLVLRGDNLSSAAQSWSAIFCNRTQGKF